MYASSVTATADNKANVRISKNGKVNAVCITGPITQGADLTGWQRFEISKQSSSSFTLNDTPNSVLCHFTAPSGSVASQITTTNILIAGLSWDVANGDTIYLHETILGTAPAGGNMSVELFVME